MTGKNIFSFSLPVLTAVELHASAIKLTSVIIEDCKECWKTYGCERYLSGTGCEADGSRCVLALHVLYQQQSQIQIFLDSLLHCGSACISSRSRHDKHSYKCIIFTHGRWASTCMENFSLLLYVPCNFVFLFHNSFYIEKDLNISN